MTDLDRADNYALYRGKCKELSEAAVATDPSLRLARGWYWCPIWNREEEHWWTVHQDGKIHDPSKLQYPSAGMGRYREYEGILTCAECGKEFPEAEDNPQGRYHCCSYRCAGRLIGAF
jgi:hypothetical protein